MPQPNLNAESYKDIVTSRGFRYHYYTAPAQGDKVTLLFLHGCPSTSRDWREIILPLEKLGYGIIIPDLLGYGDSDTPNDPYQYRLLSLSKDLTDILDEEDIKQAVVVGHDWGCFVTSRLSNYFPERFLAYAFLAVPYVEANVTIEQSMGFMTQHLGYNPYGYWSFFNQDDADEVMAAHWDSVVTISYSKDPNVFKEIVCPEGALKAALLADYIPSSDFHVVGEERKIYDAIFKKNGMAGPLCYYKCALRGFNLKDEAAIPPAKRHPQKSAPLFFGAALKDAVCTPKIGRLAFESEPFKDHNVTIKDFDADHWLNLSHGADIACELDAWVSGVVVHGV